MIITHTLNAKGIRRVYLGGKSSLECWIEPAADGIAWSFHLQPAVTGNALSMDDQRQWAVATLSALADELRVPPVDLKAVAFERIAALHTGNPFDSRRMPVPRAKSIENGFMATPPHVTRPQADFADHTYSTKSRSSSP